MLSLGIFVELLIFPDLTQGEAVINEKNLQVEGYGDYKLLRRPEKWSHVHCSGKEVARFRELLEFLKTEKEVTKD